MVGTFTKLTDEHKRNLGKEYFFLPIYPILYSALRWHYKQYQNLSPEEVWYYATLFSTGLTELTCPELQADDEIESLGDYMVNNDAAFLVALAASYRLYPLTRRDMTLKEIVTNLLNTYVKPHPLRDIMLNKIAYSEDDAKLQKFRVDIVNYQLVDIRSHTADTPQMMYLAQQYLVSEQVNEAICQGIDTMKNYENVLSAVNLNQNHIFDGQLACLQEGIRAANRHQNPQLFLFQIEKFVGAEVNVNIDKINKLLTEAITINSEGDTPGIASVKKMVIADTNIEHVDTNYQK